MKVISSNERLLSGGHFPYDRVKQGLNPSSTKLLIISRWYFHIIFLDFVYIKMFLAHACLHVC